MNQKDNIGQAMDALTIEIQTLRRRMMRCSEAVEALRKLDEAGASPPKGAGGGATQKTRNFSELIMDLEKVIPRVGDAVNVRDFRRNKSEVGTLRQALSSGKRDPRFKWKPGVSGGSVPSRIVRVKP